MVAVVVFFVVFVGVLLVGVTGATVVSVAMTVGVVPLCAAPVSVGAGPTSTSTGAVPLAPSESVTTTVADQVPGCSYVAFTVAPVAVALAAPGPNDHAYVGFAASVGVTVALNVIAVPGSTCPEGEAVAVTASCGPVNTHSVSG